MELKNVFGEVIFALEGAKKSLNGASLVGASLDGANLAYASLDGATETRNQ